MALSRQLDSVLSKDASGLFYFRPKERRLRKDAFGFRPSAKADKQRSLMAAGLYKE
jgi:hypothetical protein